MAEDQNGDTTSTRRTVPDTPPERKKPENEKSWLFSLLPAGLKREIRTFVKVTAMHGVKRWWETEKPCYKFLWFGAVFICFCAMIYLIASNTTEFLNDNGSTQVTHATDNKGKKLPKMIFCNNHPIKKSSLKKFNQDGLLSEELQRYLILSNKDPGMFGKTEDELREINDKFQAFQSAHKDFKIRNFLKETGFKCEDVFISCSFAGKQFKCCQNDDMLGIHFDSILTELGMCLSINIGAKQTSETENGGLQVILDAKSDEIVSMPIDSEAIFDSSLSEGFRFFLEEEEMATYRSSHGISVASGQSILSGIYLNEYQLEKPRCEDDWTETELKGRQTQLKYQARDCLSKCLARAFANASGCAPIAFDIDEEYPECSPIEALRWSKNTTVKVNSECPKCKVECSRLDYQSYNSYGGPLAEHVLDSLVKKFPKIEKERMKRDFTVVTIFHRELSSIVYLATGKPTLVTLFSNIGGSAGLCLGFSALTFIELIVLLGKCVWYAVKKEKLDEKGVKYKENKELTKAALESLKEKHKKKHSGTRGNTGREAAAANGNNGAGDAGGDGDSGYNTANVTPANARANYIVPANGSPVAVIHQDNHDTTESSRPSGRRHDS